MLEVSTNVCVGRVKQVCVGSEYNVCVGSVRQVCVGSESSVRVLLVTEREL